MSSIVYVISAQKKPLMPCKPAIARLLLKQGKAKCVRKTPFTIKLLCDTTEYTQDLTLGVDTGSGKVGSAVVNNNGDVLYASEMEIRNDIAIKMTRRRKYRRSRRNRKARYRQARWLNRRNSIKKDRFSPTMVSKINSHLKEIDFVKSILPISKIILETSTFDPHLMKNPKLYNEKYKRWGYQKGTNYGFANTKAYVLDRDKYTCQYCKGKSKNNKLEIHHIIFRSNGGSDEQENLITLCKVCHDSLHRGKIKLDKIGKVKGQLKHATQMNSIRIQLLKRLPDAEETFGFVTKEHRQALNLPKSHYIDAAIIASQGKKLFLRTNTVLLKKCVSDGDYQQAKGVRSERRIPTCKIQGFRKFDKVKYRGKECFIKGRYSTGYAVLMDVYGNKIDFKDSPKGMRIPKLKNMKKIASRKSWIISQETIQSIC